MVKETSQIFLFDFGIVYECSGTLGLVGDLSRQCSDLEDITVAAESLWHERFTVNVVSELYSFFKRKRSTITQKKENCAPKLIAGSKI